MPMYALQYSPQKKDENDPGSYRRVKRKVPMSAFFIVTPAVGPEAAQGSREF